jgi:hypothetical protein
MESELFQWLSGMPWFGWVAIVAIVCGSISAILRRRYQHVERIEMIRHGLDPDSGKPTMPPEV